MNKVKVFCLVILMVNIYSCGTQNNTAASKEDISTDVEVLVKDDPNTVVPANQIEEIKSFALSYLIERTGKSAIYKYDLLNIGAVDKYYSEMAQFMGKRSSQSILVISGQYKVIDVHVFNDRVLGFKNNIEVRGNKYRVRIEESIVGEIINSKYFEKANEHFVDIFVITSDAGFKIYDDSDIFWLEGFEGKLLAIAYIFQKDVDKVIK